MTAGELHHAEAAYRAARRESEGLRANRNALIATALANGWTHAAIAQATGLTRGRVGQLAQRAGEA